MVQAPDRVIRSSLDRGFVFLIDTQFSRRDVHPITP
ncbi:hypothetical protein [Candidatus Nitrotoga arctica]|nr:hypothetical protein [Candidatus Nitrotoga arctica]